MYVNKNSKLILLIFGILIIGSAVLYQNYKVKKSRNNPPSSTTTNRVLFNTKKYPSNKSAGSKEIVFETKEQAQEHLRQNYNFQIDYLPEDYTVKVQPGAFGVGDIIWITNNENQENKVALEINSIKELTPEQKLNIFDTRLKEFNQNNAEIEELELEVKKDNVNKAYLIDSELGQGSNTQVLISTDDYTYNYVTMTNLRNKRTNAINKILIHRILLTTEYF